MGGTDPRRCERHAPVGRLRQPGSPLDATAMGSSKGSVRSWDDEAVEEDVSLG